MVATGCVAPVRSSAARAALRSTRLLLHFFGPVTPVQGARGRLVCTTRYRAVRQRVRARIPQGLLARNKCGGSPCPLGWAVVQRTVAGKRGAFPVAGLPAVVVAGAALAGDGWRGGPAISRLLHGLPGPLRAPSPASAAPTGAPAISMSSAQFYESERQLAMRCAGGARSHRR